MDVRRMNPTDITGKEIEVGQMVKVVERPNPLVPKGTPLPEFKGVVFEIAMGDDLDWVVRMYSLETWAFCAAHTRNIRVQWSADKTRAAQEAVLDGAPAKTATHRHFLAYAENTHKMRPAGVRGLVVQPQEEKK